MAERNKPPRTPPRYCTFECPHSDFPPADTAGLCRTMAAVYCRRLRKLVEKNAPCRLREPARRHKCR